VKLQPESSTYTLKHQCRVVTARKLFLKLKFCIGPVVPLMLKFCTGKLLLQNHQYFFWIMHSSGFKETTVKESTTEITTEGAKYL
jgi:hypothetical protein